MFDYAGCIHFHSSYSYDAYQPLEKIVAAGLKTGLDYAILTDHFRLDARQDGWERYHTDPSGRRKLLLMVGEEISPRYNHYLAFQLRQAVVVPKNKLNAQAVIDAVAEQGGFGFIAHPFHQGAPLVGSRAYPWLDWNVKGFSGMSIWDLIGDWQCRLQSPWAILKASLWPGRVLEGPHQETLARWDALCETGHYAAIAELDNHANRKHFWGFSRHLFPFDFAFRTLRTHLLAPNVLSGEAAADIPVLLDALRRGQSYISLDLWQDPRGFTFEIFDSTKRATMGGEFQRGTGATLLEVKCPQPGRVRICRNGRVIREERRRAYTQMDVEHPGVYRVEVQQRAAGRWRPWIYSNPIWVV